MGYYVEPDGTVRSERSVKEEIKENVRKARSEGDSQKEITERHSVPVSVEYVECKICHMKVRSQGIGRHMKLHGIRSKRAIRLYCSPVAGPFSAGTAEKP